MRVYPLCALLVIAALFFSCPTDKTGTESTRVRLDMRTAAPQGNALAIDPDFAGMCHSGYSDNLDREYTMLREMGVKWLHRDFSWWRIQPVDENSWDFDDYDWYVKRANDEGIKIMGMLLYDSEWAHTKTGNPSVRKVWPDEIPYFVDYAVETVQRYNGKNGHGKVDAWLIWNEPNLAPRFWTSDDPKDKGKDYYDPDAKKDFFALTKATAEAIRELDKTEGTHTTLVGGVFSILADKAWIDGLFQYEDGAIKDVLDGVSIHPYGAGALATEALLKDFQQKVAPYGFADKIWANEMGYPTYPERGPIPAGRDGNDQYEGDMPEVAVKTIALLAAAGAKNFAWYHLFDSSPERNIENPGDWHGLIWKKSADEWVRKGGYWGYALCAKHLPGKSYQKLSFADPVPDDITTCYFKGSDGARTLIVWSNNPLSPIDVTISFNGSDHTLWDTATGQPSNVDATVTRTLYPANTDRQSLLFVTWKE